MRILVIKLGSLGDVIRTTSILPLLYARDKSPRITWLTRKEATDLLRGNPYIAEIVEYSFETLLTLTGETFDIAINLDCAREGASLIEMARAREKLGFGLSERGSLYPLTPEAWDYYEMGINDSIKKANRKTYQQLINEIARLNAQPEPPLLVLEEEELAFAERFKRARGIEESRPLVGINTGGGTRWPLKRWTMSGFSALMEALEEELQAQVLLLGGPEEVAFNQAIMEKTKANLIDAGCFNSVRQFASLIKLCDLMVTGDSLAMQIAVALGTNSVVLMGPTSASEIDLFGRGKIITPPLECLGCYNVHCQRTPNCMESITVEEVMEAVKELLDHRKEPRP